MAHFTLRLPDDLASRFDLFAVGQGGRSRVIRRMIQAAMGGPDTGEASRGGRRGAKEKVTVRLREEDLVALDLASRSAGLRRTEWICSALRSRLHDRAQFDRPQLEALTESRQELARISANLRELVRSVRDADAPVGELQDHLERVEEVRLEVRAALDELRVSVDGSRVYWKGSE